MKLKELFDRTLKSYRNTNSQENLKKALDLLTTMKTKKYEVDYLLDFISSVSKKIEDSDNLKETTELFKVIFDLIDQKNPSLDQSTYNYDKEIVEQSEIYRKFTVSLLNSKVLDKLVRLTHQKIEAPNFN